MKVVTVPTEQTFLSDLLMHVEEEGLLLQTDDGQQFVLFSLADWQGFEVGDSEDFEEEVRKTAANQALMAFLAERKRDSERVSMQNVKELLGLT